MSEPQVPVCGAVPDGAIGTLNAPTGHPGCAHVVVGDSDGGWQLLDLREGARPQALDIPAECGDDAATSKCLVGGGVVIERRSVDEVVERPLVLAGLPNPRAETLDMLWLLEPGHPPNPLWRELPVVGDGTAQGPAFELWPHRCAVEGDARALALVPRARFGDGSDGAPTRATVAGTAWLDPTREAAPPTSDHDCTPVGLDLP